jgi:argininosuccinate lyase
MRNSLDGVSDRDFALDYLQAAAQCSLHLSRLAEEFVIWASQPFGFVRMADSLSTGSSIMPQKKNPDVAEIVRGKSARAIGNLMQSLTLLKGLPLSYNRDLQEDKEPLFDTVDTLLASLAVTAAMLPALRFDGERGRAMAVGQFALATDVADYLARRGVPFREAHAAVGTLVAKCERENRRLEDLTVEEYRAVHPAFDSDVLAIDLDSALRARAATGGTAPEAVAGERTAARARLDAEDVA